MVAHALDWGNSLNPCRRGGQMAHHGGDVCGFSCVRWWPQYYTIPTVQNLPSGSFCFRLNQNSGGLEGRPNNLQSAWCLAELFFWSDLSWSRANLYANSYEISTHFSLLSTMPWCTHYISYVGILQIIHNVLFRISIIFNNMAMQPYRFSSYLWLFVFFDFWITCTYHLILFFDISSHCVF